MHAHSDQAAGLRRLFRRTPPAVFAPLRDRAVPLKTAARAVRSLTEGGRRVVVLEEHGEATGSLFGSFGTDGGADLLATLERGLDPADTLREAADGLWLVRAAATAQAVPWLDAGHLSRLESAIGELQRRADLLAVHAAGDGAGLTPFAQAAARRLLVVEASGVGARGACQWIKGLAAAGAGSLEVAVSGARDRADATALFASLSDYTARHVGLPLVWRGELERDGLAEAMSTPLGARHPAEGVQAFVRRLRAWSAQASAAG